MLTSVCEKHFSLAYFTWDVKMLFRKDNGRNIFCQIDSLLHNKDVLRLLSNTCLWSGGLLIWQKILLLFCCLSKNICRICVVGYSIPHIVNYIVIQLSIQKSGIGNFHFYWNVVCLKIKPQSVCTSCDILNPFRFFFFENHGWKWKGS